MSAGHIHQRKKGSFIESTIEGLHYAMERALYAENKADGRGLLQALDPRVKVAGLLALIVASGLSAHLGIIAVIFALSILLAALSFIPIGILASRVWAGVILFTVPLAVPAIFLTPGAVLYRVPGFDWPVTAQGLHTASFLVLRVLTAASLALLLIFTTPWMHVLKALRIFRVPLVLVMILGMTCRYILLMLETAHEMFQSRKSRTVGRLTPGDNRRLAVSSAGVLLSKTYQMSGEVFLAMQSRGFRGEVRLLDDFQMKRRDWAASAAFGGMVVAFVWMGR